MRPSLDKDRVMESGIAGNGNMEFTAQTALAGRLHLLGIDARAVLDHRARVTADPAAAQTSGGGRGRVESRELGSVELLLQFTQTEFWWPPRAETSIRQGG